MAQQLLMPKATAVWLVDNTALSFEQIAQFCKLHPLEVKAIADGESAQGIKGLDPIATGQLSRDEIARAEANPNHKLKLSEPKVRVPDSKRKGPRYTPVSKRQDRPNAILWLVRNHPELKDAQISRLVGTTKSTIEQIRERTHWNSTNLTAMDPVTLGLCTPDRPRPRSRTRLQGPAAADRCRTRRNTGSLEGNGKAAVLLSSAKKRRKWTPTLFSPSSSRSSPTARTKTTTITIDRTAALRTKNPDH